MATIKIPYQYTEFKDSPLATWADKKVQQGSDMLIANWLLEFAPLGLIIFSLAPDRAANPAMYNVCTVLMALCLLVLPFAFHIIFKLMWNKKRLANKLAACDIRRRSDAAMNRKFRAWSAAIITVLVLIPVIGGICLTTMIN